jgi:hypothetical protein
VLIRCEKYFPNIINSLDLIICSNRKQSQSSAFETLLLSKIVKSKLPTYHYQPPEFAILPWGCLNDRWILVPPVIELLKHPVLKLANWGLTPCYVTMFAKFPNVNICD